MKFNTVAHFLLLTVASSDAAFLRSGAEEAAAAGVCSDGQIYVVNNCGETLRHGSEVNWKARTKTIQSGCQDLLGPEGQRIWVGSDDSTVYTKGFTLFEYAVWSSGKLSWDVSLLSGYNYPVKVENNGQTLLDVTGPSCGGFKEGLFPCTQKANTCVEGSPKWRDDCAGCNSSCCDHIWGDKEFACDPPAIDNGTQNMVLTFCPNN